MDPMVEWSVIYEPADGWIQARLRELPGVITVGRTREEARTLVVDALREYLLSLSETPSDDPDGDVASERLEIRLVES